MKYKDAFSIKFHILPLSYKKQGGQKIKELLQSTYYLGTINNNGKYVTILKDSMGQIVTDFNKKNNFQKIFFDLYHIPNNTIFFGEYFKKDNDYYFKILDLLKYDSRELLNIPMEERVKIIYKEFQSSNFIILPDYKEGNELWNLYCNTIICNPKGIIIFKKDYLINPNKVVLYPTLKIDNQFIFKVNVYINGEYEEYEKECNEKNLEEWQYWLNFKTGEKKQGEYFDEYVNGKSLEPVSEQWFYDQVKKISFSVIDGKEGYQAGKLEEIPEEIKKEIKNNKEKWTGKVITIETPEIIYSKDRYYVEKASFLEYNNNMTIEQCTIKEIEKKFN